MKTLIISDESHKESFRQIKNISDLIEKENNSSVDTLIISEDAIYLNGQNVTKETDYLIDFEAINRILDKGRYELCFISLISKTFKPLLSSNGKFFELAERYFKASMMFIFCAPSVISKIEKYCEKKQINLYLEPRYGVARISRNLKGRILEYVQNRISITRVSEG